MDTENVDAKNEEYPSHDKYRPDDQLQHIPRNL